MGQVQSFLFPVWLMPSTRTSNKDLYLPKNIFFPSSLNLGNDKIALTEKKYQTETDNQLEKFQHKHVTFGKIRSKWKEDFTLAGMRQVS